MPEQQHYDASSFEPAKLRAFARKVAQELLATRGATIRLGQAATRGWLIGELRNDETQVNSTSHERLFFFNHHREVGSRLLLGDDGQVYIAQYTKNEMHSDMWPERWRNDDTISDARIATDSELLFLDYRSKGGMRTVAPNRRMGETYREELTHRHVLVLKEKGLGVSRALSQLRKATNPPMVELAPSQSPAPALAANKPARWAILLCILAIGLLAALACCTFSIFSLLNG